MECNKDEALRAKDIAIRKFTEGDFNGAKKFALKAQTLYNGLDGITQMISTLDVYISTENKINGEIDMYGILGVSPLADDETIKKQYRKLLLQLHPDKNKFIGADGAFQRVSEAFNLLSDKAKRAAYNSRRNIKPAQAHVGPTWPKPKFPTQPSVSVPTSRSNQKVPTQSGNSRGVNGFHKSPGITVSRGRPRKSTKSNKSQTEASRPTETFVGNEDTFWTRCGRCMMQYEYMRVYLNQILKCPHCQAGFSAIEVPPPSNISPPRSQHRRNSNSGSGSQKTGHFDNSGNRWGPQFDTTNYNGSGSNFRFLDREKAKREYEAALAAAKRGRDSDPGFVLSGERPEKRTREMDDRVPNYGGSMGISHGQSRENSGGRGNFFTNSYSNVYNMGRELSGMELRNMLSKKALDEIRKKLKEWKLGRVSTKEKEKAKQNERLKSKLANDEITSPFHDDDGDDDDDDDDDEMTMMSVPDPDFHVFDSDRSESCFSENQVWALYDSDDGMPRFYAMIHEVLSTNPFKVRFSWLNPNYDDVFGPLNWEDQGLIKCCGDFSIGKCETNTTLNSFSHKVNWVKGYHGAIRVFPGKGDIWALYKNWSHEWKKDTPEEIIHAYEVVEVLDNYNEERGVYVSPLVKIPGFLSVFSKNPNPNMVSWIPRGEIFRFSHQIPSHVLTGEEGPNAPKGYIELDPASTPSELLKK